MTAPLARNREHARSTNLVDVLDRVLDKGLVVAGDVRISLAEVELLTIRIRLLVCSIDKAEEIGLDWWRHDPSLGGGALKLEEEKKALEERVRLLEKKLAERPAAPAKRKTRARKRRSST
jgi:hypothetical protein